MITIGVCRKGTSVCSILEQSVFLRRNVSTSTRLFARRVSIDNDDFRARNKQNAASWKAPSRQEKIDRVNFQTLNKLQEVDKIFSIFDKNVTRIVDLGFVPGNWCGYARDRLEDLHKVEKNKLHEVCHILGFDLLFCQPPAGVSSMQGNIFSKTAHKKMMDYFKNLAFQQKTEATKSIPNSDFQMSYFLKEIKESAGNIDLANKEFQQKELVEFTKDLDYKPQLILSDLSAPLMQQSGFFNNTSTKPYLRAGSNPILSRPMVEVDGKSSIDLADASLVLACDLLRQGGTMVLRLVKIDNHDRELELLLKRLSKVFRFVRTWRYHETPFLRKNRELFCVCKYKIEDSSDKRWVFLY